MEADSFKYSNLSSRHRDSWLAFGGRDCRRSCPQRGVLTGIYRQCVKTVKDSAEKAGRDFSSFEVAQIINCSVEDDHKKALDAVRWEVATKLDPVQISFIAAPKMRVGEPYIRKEDIPLFEKAHAEGGMDGLIKAIPDSYVEGMTASGTPDEVKSGCSSTAMPACKSLS